MALAGENRSFAQYLAARRSVPAANLGLPAPGEDAIGRILEIAARVPDHGKLSPWRFIRYPTEAAVSIGEYLSGLWARENPDTSQDRLALEKERFSRAPVVVGVVSSPVRDHKIPVWEQELSAGAVCLNLVHAAHAFGFSAQWLTEWYSYNTESVRYLGALEGERFAGFIHIGTPSIAPVERARPALQDITTIWRAAAEAAAWTAR